MSSHSDCPTFPVRLFVLQLGLGLNHLARPLLPSMATFAGGTASLELSTATPIFYSISRHPNKLVVPHTISGIYHTSEQPGYLSRPLISYSCPATTHFTGRYSTGCVFLAADILASWTKITRQEGGCCTLPFDTLGSSSRTRSCTPCMP